MLDMLVTPNPLFLDLLKGEQEAGALVPHKLNLAKAASTKDSQLVKVFEFIQFLSFRGNRGYQGGLAFLQTLDFFRDLTRFLLICARVDG